MWSTGPLTAVRRATPATKMPYQRARLQQATTKLPNPPPHIYIYIYIYIYADQHAQPVANLYKRLQSSHRDSKRCTLRNTVRDTKRLPCTLRDNKICLERGWAVALCFGFTTAVYKRQTPRTSLNNINPTFSLAKSEYDPNFRREAWQNRGPTSHPHRLLYVEGSQKAVKPQKLARGWHISARIRTAWGSKARWPTPYQMAQRTRRWTQLHETIWAQNSSKKK